MFQGSGKINSLLLSDIHLFHGRVSTKHIVKSLMIAIPDNSTIDDLDIIFLAGDVFDKSVDLPDASVSLAHGWISGLLDLCFKRNIKLRVLEGTPSHDRKQSSLFLDVNESKGDRRADLRYIDILTIDYEEDYDIHILYVPDEWHSDLDVVWEQVQEQLRLNGIDKVQISIMHGMFGHQVPPGIPLEHHDAQRYISITEWFVHIGHIHIASVYDIIYATGSIERLSMGEEGPKGHYRVTVTQQGSSHSLESTFMENMNAVKQKTYDVRELQFEDAITFLKAKAVEQKKGFIRILASWDLNREGILTAMSERYPDITWTKKIDKVQMEERGHTDGMFEMPEVKPITSSTIAEQLATRLKDLTDPVNKRAMEILAGVLNG